MRLKTTLTQAGFAPGAPAPPITAAASPMWTADGRPFRADRVAPMRHALADHPLLQLPRLRRLAESFAGTSHLKFVAPDRKKNSAFYTLSESEAKKDIRSTFDQLDSPGTWVALYFAEADPDYRAFVAETLDGMKPLVEPVDPGMHGYNLFIFIAAPPTVTPFHIDRENNFNVQVLGRKRLRVWAPDDRIAVPDEAIEDYFVRNSLSGLRYDDSIESRALDLDVGPGDGVYIPSTAGHFVSTEDNGWAGPGNGVSISVALTYFTAATRRRAHAYALNQFLRTRFSAQPTSPGTSPLVDTLKYPFARALVLARRALRHEPIPRGL